MTFNRLHLIRQVDLFTLRLFLSAVEEEQIGRAAIRENIAASTATKRIQDLERIAGVPLLERTPKGVTPSPAGQVVVRYIRTILDQLENMRAEITAFTEGVRGEVTIASARSIISPFLAREIGEYARDFPSVEVIVNEMENARIVPAVAHGEADIGVFAMARELDLNHVEVIPYRKDRMVAVVSRRHPLAERSSVSFEELLPENVIAVQAMVHVLQSAAKRLGYDFNPKYHVRSGGVAISLVEAGFGVTIQPECLVGKEALENVTIVDLTEPWANRSICIALARGRAPTAASKELLQQLMDRPGVPLKARRDNPDTDARSD